MWRGEYYSHFSANLPRAARIRPSADATQSFEIETEERRRVLNDIRVAFV